VNARSLLLVAGGTLAAGGVAAAALTRGMPAGQVILTMDGDGRVGPDSARVARFLGALESGDAILCEMVADQLGNFWWSGSEANLGRFADAGPRMLAARDSLSGNVTDPGAIRLLRAALSTDQPCVRRVAAKMLGRGRANAVQLAELLGHPEPRVREAAAYAAGAADRHDLRPALESMLTDRAGDAAVMAAWALGEIEERASLDPLSRAVRSANPRLRLAAVWAQGEIEDPEAVPRLLPTLRDDDALVRATAARALGQIESRRATEPLQEALRDPDARVRAAAAEALGQIEDERAAESLEQLLRRDPVAPVREASAHALGQLARARSAEALGLAAEDPERRVRYAAVEALADLDDLERAPAPLLRAIGSDDPGLRRRAAETIAEIADPATVPILLPLLDDPDPELRARVVNALGEIGTREAIPGLLRALKDSDPEVRRAAADALGEVEKRR